MHPILRLDKSDERLEALGLSLAEAKTLQERLQRRRPVGGGLETLRHHRLTRVREPDGEMEAGTEVWCVTRPVTGPGRAVPSRWTPDRLNVLRQHLPRVFDPESSGPTAFA
jgi:hypothetical protein